MHIHITNKGRKLLELCEAKGFENVAALIGAAASDRISPGICSTEGCRYTCEVEPAEDAGYCEACGGQTVVSALRLAGLV